MGLNTIFRDRILTHLSVVCLAAVLASAITGVEATYAGAESSKQAGSGAAARTATEQRYLEWAERGNAAAQYNLALMYDKGDRVRQDRAEAAKWYRRAGEQGVVFAQHNLALLYEQGEGIKQDYIEAAKWYRKAAEQGNIDAQYNLALMYKLGKIGRGSAQDYAEAAKWCRKAADRGHVAAQFLLADLYELGDNDVEAAQWYRRMANKGRVRAQIELGTMYASGRGVERNYTEAVRWWGIAAAKGEAKAQWHLGSAYRTGQGVEQNYLEAVKWYRRAADQGDPEAQCYLGLMYVDGLGVEQDKAEAVRWLGLAAEQGHINSMNLLGYMYSFGVGVEQDYTEAARWYRKAAEAVRTVPEFSEGVRSMGTGFFISSEGLLLTAQHVISEARKIKVQTSKGVFSARVVFQDDTTATAILQVDQDAKFDALALASNGDVSVGDEVFTVGFPSATAQEAEPKYVEGVVDTIRGPANDPRYCQISIPNQQGLSGGPLVDARGNVVGIVNAKAVNPAKVRSSRTPAQSANYAVRSSFIQLSLKSLPSAIKASLPNSRSGRVDRSTAVAEVRKAVALVLCY